MTALYRIYGERAALLYVGISDDLDTRMRTHAEKAWWPQVRRIDATDYPTRIEAIAAERAAITAERPQYNRTHNAEVEERPKSPKIRRHPAPRRWLSQQEAAEYLGVTDRTIRNYISRGLLQGNRVRGSRLVRIDHADLDALLRPIPTAGAAS